MCYKVQSTTTSLCFYFCPQETLDDDLVEAGSRPSHDKLEGHARVAYLLTVCCKGLLSRFLLSYRTWVNTPNLERKLAEMETHVHPKWNPSESLFTKVASPESGRGAKC